jgi:carbonic anhydrase
MGLFIRTGGVWATTIGLGATLFVGCAVEDQSAKRIDADRAQPAADVHAAADGVTPAAAMQMLTEGNARFVADHASHPHQSAGRRTELAQTQKPFAVILACADSRVSPEVVFDTGLGDLFVVRVAGNVADDTVLGSIEYAVEHLGSPLVVVMGHERCGAVKATIDAAGSKEPIPGHIGALVSAVKPALEAEPPTPADTLLDRVVVANVRHVTSQISADELVAHLVKEGKVKVVGGRYDLDTGEFKLVETPASGAGH